MSAVVATGELECKSDREAIWRVVSDTERMKRAAGAGGVEVRPQDKGAARYALTTRAGPVTLQIDELPYEWVEGERLYGKQIVTKGPLKELALEIRLSSTPGGGTKVHVELKVEPRNRLLGMLARAGAKRGVNDVLGVLRKADEALVRGESPFKAIAPAPPPVPAAAVDRAGEDLARLVTPAQAPLARRLVDLVRSGDDADVSHIRPFELADAWGADRREVVTVCLAAVVAGLLELRWGMVCPSCEQASEEATDLAGIGAEGHCHLCDLGFGVDFERAVEATFRPAAAVRAVDAKPRCISGPARTPHVVSQALLPAHGTAQLRVPAVPGRYRLFLRGGSVATVDAADGALSSARVTAAFHFETPQLSVAPGGTIEVTSTTADDRHVKLERSEYASRAATAHFVATIPAFRRLFSGQVVKPGLLLKVSRAALLFTDLAGSTALYTRAGDASAFRVVMDHFDLLRDEVERHRGAVVKTIGDSVMAVFLDDADACRAAVSMVRAFSAYRARTPDASTLALRVGVHGGPVYAVNANKMLDYFGQTVNVAARLQGQAHPDEVVMDVDLAVRGSDAGWLAGAEICEKFDCTLKGLEGITHAARVRPTSEPHGMTHPPTAAAGGVSR